MECDIPKDLFNVGGDIGDFGREGVVEYLRGVFAGWEDVATVLDATEEDQIFERRMYDRPPLGEADPEPAYDATTALPTKLGVKSCHWLL